MSAGNILSGITSLFGQHGEKHIFGSSFSQFVKGSAEMKYYHRFRAEHWLATRLFIGAEHAYGNSKEVPYSEQFYIGGANSIRAFTIRSLGPGSYVPAKDDVDGYFDQTGTFKLEANIEYRFPIWGDLHGAAFVDAGNIWLLKKDPKRPGGELDRKTFLKDIALGTGIGLRYDIGMLVLRGDLGIGIHAPYDTGKKGYYNMTSFKNSLAFHLAIGYPF
jgi:outer membrane protein assembly factor BamA